MVDEDHGLLKNTSTGKLIWFQAVVFETLTWWIPQVEEKIKKEKRKELTWIAGSQKLKLKSGWGGPIRGSVMKGVCLNVWS